MASLIDDLLYPATDAGVAAQVITVVFGAAVVVVLARHERSLVLFTIGTAMLVLGFFGLRALH